LPWRRFLREQSGRDVTLSTNPYVALRFKIIAGTLPLFLPSWQMQGHLYFNCTFLGMRKTKKNMNQSSAETNPL